MLIPHTHAIDVDHVTKQDDGTYVCNHSCAVPVAKSDLQALLATKTAQVASLASDPVAAKLAAANAAIAALNALLS